MLEAESKILLPIEFVLLLILPFQEAGLPPNHVLKRIGDHLACQLVDVVDIVVQLVLHRTSLILPLPPTRFDQLNCTKLAANTAPRL